MKLRKFIQGRIASIKTREGQRGQILYMVPVIIIAIAALIGAAIDTSIWIANNIIANNNAAIACLAAADAHWRDPDTYLQVFQDILADNNVPVDAYSPQEGSGVNLKRGLIHEGSSIRVALSWTLDTNFMRIVGVDQVPVWGKARCIGPAIGLSPIAVREPAILQDDYIEQADCKPEYWIDGSCKYQEEHPILGKTSLNPWPSFMLPEDWPFVEDGTWPLADVDSGLSFAGAIIPQIVCQATGEATVEHCPDYIYYSNPPGEDLSNPQTQKNLAENCIRQIDCNINYIIGDHIPIVQGVSDSFLCHAFQDKYEVGDIVIVVVFGGPDGYGTVYNPDPGYSNWENVQIKYYAKFEVVAYESNVNNCNQVWARLYGGYANPEMWKITNLDDLEENFKPREISWTFNGVLP
jgi:hypothetical protein